MAETNRRCGDGSVIKLGGSLLDLDDVPARLMRWLAREPSQWWLLIVGGGMLADGVRQLDRRYRICPQSAHWQAIRAMKVNAFALHQVVPNSAWIQRTSDWPPEGNGQIAEPAFLDVETFLRDEEPHLPGEVIPCGWHVSSDSIAARVAEVVGAAELVLLKSTLPDSGSRQIQLRDAVRLGLVDPHLPALAEHLPKTRAVNLRDWQFPEIALVPAPGGATGNS